MEVPVREKLLAIFLAVVCFTSFLTLTYLLVMPTPTGTAIESLDRN